MSEPPEWALSVPDLDPNGDWLPIVCTGRGPLAHPFELIGIYFEGDIGWKYAGRPGPTPRGLLAYVRPPSAGWTEYVDEQGRPHARNDGPGSMVAACPTCSAEHRVKRTDWDKFLENSRGSVPRWADVASLPS